MVIGLERVPKELHSILVLAVVLLMEPSYFPLPAFP